MSHEEWIELDNSVSEQVQRNIEKQTLRTVELVGGPYDGELVTLFKFVAECQMQGRADVNGRSAWHSYKMTTRDNGGRCVFEYEGCY